MLLVWEADETAVVWSVVGVVEVAVADVALATAVTEDVAALAEVVEVVPAVVVEVDVEVGAGVAVEGFETMS